MIRYITKNDEGQILSMMELVKDDFAVYKEKEFLEAIHNAIVSDEAIMEEVDGEKLTVFDYPCQKLILRL